MYYVYILTNKNHTVLYTGVTVDLRRRVFQHKTKFYKNSFTAQYNCDKLLYFETYQYKRDAMHRERQLKKYKRPWKENLINSQNPDWLELKTD